MMDAHINHSRGLRNGWRLLLWGGLALVLSLPALAMSLGAEGVDWSAFDFIIMGALMALFALAIEGSARLFITWPARLTAMGFALFVFLAIWAELAVGVFGTPFAGS